MRLLIAGLAATAVLATAACDPNTGQPSNRVVGGAVVGATTGALLGLLAGGDDRRNALVGAGIGLLAGAAIGNYLDNQQRALQQDLEGTGAQITRQGDRILVTLPENITFATGSAALNDRSRRVIGQLAKSLNRYPSSYIDVIGHTDSTGSSQFNKQLSIQRAQAVENALIRRNVNPARIRSAGRGETQPIASNATPEGRALNRRVDVYIIPASR
jgi:outer membrane protein OmpA-like peptidoglycan-associated protein